MLDVENQGIALQAQRSTEERRLIIFTGGIETKRRGIKQRIEVGGL